MNQSDSRHDKGPTDHSTEVISQAISQADIAELIEITRGEGEAIRLLNLCVAQLCRVQAAKEALLQVAPAQLRAALLRHLPPGLLQEESR